MSLQTGFDFGDETATSTVPEAVDGVWLEPLLTAEQFEEVFALFDVAVDGLPAATRPLFVAGVGGARLQLQLMKERLGSEVSEPFRLWRSSVDLDAEVIAKFVAYCATANAGNGANYEFKIAKRGGFSLGLTAAGVHIHGIGSVVASEMADGGFCVNYWPYRDKHFLPSFGDDVPVIKEPCSTWAKAYCADKLSESGDSPATVPTFILSGREYVNSGGMSFGSFRSCTAWSFVPAASWNGQTYTYRTLIDAYDRGAVERGDKRGMLLKVRGQLCVLDGCVTVYDDRAFEHVVSSELIDVGERDE